MTTRYFSYIADRIGAAKAKADLLASGIDHPGLVGEIREIAIRDCVEPFLTQSYECGTGKIIDSFGRLSDQIDLAVYHRKVVPPILVNRDLGLFPIECVRYAFEVKSKITSDEIRDSNKKFVSISRLMSFPQKQTDGTLRGGIHPSTVLFAFGSDIQGSEIERYLKYTDNKNPPCVVLCVLGKGYWWYHEKNWYGRDTSSLAPYTEFCWFMGGFMNSLSREETSLRPFHPGAYLNLGDDLLKPIQIAREPPQAS